MLDAIRHDGIHHRRPGRLAWSVVAVVALLFQVLGLAVPVSASDAFAIDAAAICSATAGPAGDTGKAHDPSASHCPLCQNLGPSLALLPPAPAIGLPQGQALRSALPSVTVFDHPIHSAGFHSRAPPPVFC